MNDLKIIVGCHKPYYYPDIIKNHPGIFIPILCGAAESNVEPFWPGMIRDDYFDNISWLNPYYSEYTCLYWAWKNYDMIGNPEYFGFAQYHRFLDIDNILKDLDPNKVHVFINNTILSNYDHYSISEGNLDKFDIMYSIIKRLGESDSFDNFLNDHFLPSCTLFVAHRDVFFKLMEFLNIFLQEFCVHINFSSQKYSRDCRYFSFMLERLTGYFFLHNYEIGAIKLIGQHLITDQWSNYNT